MQLNEFQWVSGYVTKEKFVRGRTLQEMERILGFQHGRFERGIVVIRLERLPTIDEFSLAAFSMVAEHRYQEPTDLDIQKVKHLAMSAWSLDGFERLIKVRANTPHSADVPPDEQYPPGTGAPQWKITTKIPGKIVSLVSDYPGGRYIPRD